MPVTHAFVSEKEDGDDETLVRPSNWNADHEGTAEPEAHASDHIDGTDDIQSATAAQKGVATVAQITKLDGIEASATADQTKAEIDALGLSHDSLADVSTSDHHTKYTDTDAVTAMGVKGDANPLNHDKATVGGLYGINVEELADAKTLTAGTDEIYQYLDPGGANRIITLDTASATAGDRFVIRNMDDAGHAHYLDMRQAANEMDTIYANDVREFIFNGTNWEGLGIGTRGVDITKARTLGIGALTISYNYGTAIGHGADAENYGASLGYAADATTEGVAVGYLARGDNYGVGVGHEAYGGYYGIAVGWHTKTNSKINSIALGYRSETERNGETSINIDGTSDQENNAIQGRWEAQTSNNTPIAMNAGGQSAGFGVRASSALAFTMKIVARDNVAGEVAMYTFEGLIKRDAANNTAMSVINKAIIHEDDATWDVAVTADDTNEALIITVTGDGANATQWAAVMDGVETHF